MKASTEVALSEREKAVLRGIVKDKTYPEIAHELGLSFETVKTYAARLRSKLGIATKVGLALWAVNNMGVLDEMDAA